MNWIGYAKAGREFEVAEAIEATGASASVPRKVEAKRVPTKRRPVPVTTPYLANYVFIDCTAEQWHAIRGVKHLASTMRMVPAGEVKHLRRFVDAIESAYDSEMQRIEAGGRVEEYAPGEALRIISGPFGDMLATFRRVVEKADGWPEIEAEGELMGRAVRFRVDPVKARKAG